MSKKKSKIDGGYVIIPKRTLKCNQWKNLDHCGKIVYMAMLTEFIRDKKINPDCQVNITQKQIEAITSQSHGTVVSGIKALKKSGFIRVEKDNQGGLERNYTTYNLDGRFLW